MCGAFFGVAQSEAQFLQTPQQQVPDPLKQKLRDLSDG